MTAHSLSGNAYRHRHLWNALAIVVCVALMRSLYISLYGSETPFWDQWDFLQDTLARWKNGNLSLKDLLSAHNEHRILYTRLISIALLSLDGGIWSNLTEAYVNTFIYAGILALLYIFLCRDIEVPVYRRSLFISVIVVGCLPFDWENNLVGFQNQFYMMLASVIIGTGIAAHSRLGRASSWLLLLISFAALFTMASGLLTALAIVAVIGLRLWPAPSRPIYGFVMFTALLAISLLGLSITPDIPGHHVLRAQGFGEHIRAFITMLIWPVQPLTLVKAIFAIIIWLPTAIWLLRYLSTSKSNNGEFFAVGIAIWCLLQALAFAHARGHNPTGLPSRYMLIPAIGLLANLALAIHLALASEVSRLHRILSSVGVVIGVTLIAAALAWRTPDDIESMKQRHQFNLIESFYTQNYLRSKDANFLQQPSLMIPYPSAAKLREFLDEASIQQMLPPSLQVNRSSPNAPHGRDENDTHAGQIAMDFERLQKATQEILGVNDSDSAVPAFLVVPSQDTTTDSFTTGLCSFDSINGRSGINSIVQRTNDSLETEGWIIDPRSSPSKQFVILLKGTKRYVLKADTRRNRKDVVEAMKSQASHTFGFYAFGILRDVAPGEYNLSLATPPPAPQELCHNSIKVVVVEQILPNQP